MSSLDDEVTEILSASKTQKQPYKPPPRAEKARVKETGCFACVAVRQGCIATQGGKAPVVVMELESDDGETAIKFFNVRVTKAKNLAVPRNSDFARLYRLATGENPVARFSRINTLLKHFIGIEFQCTTTRDTDKKGSEFFKVTRIAPSAPHISDTWTTTGSELKRASKQTKKSPQNAVKNQQDFGNDLSIFCQFSDNTKSSQAKPDMGCSQFESHLTSNVITQESNRTSVPSPKPVTRSPRTLIWQKRPDESEDDFLDRFLDDTLSRPPHQPFSSQAFH